MGQLEDMSERHVRQLWFVGQRVRVKFRRESALRNVQNKRLTATGTISKCWTRFPRTTELRTVVYQIELDSEILGEWCWDIIPGNTNFDLELLKE